MFYARARGHSSVVDLFTSNGAVIVDDGAEITFYHFDGGGDGGDGGGDGGGGDGGGGD